MDSKDSTANTAPSGRPSMENNVRLWDAAFELWKNRGNPLNDPEVPMPSKHP